jgi:hypothetical protein
MPTIQIDPIILRENNPYSLSDILVLSDGSLVLERHKVVYVKSDKDRYFTTIQNDTLWNIAHQAYGDSKLWWIIADVNPSIESPFDLEPGLSLLIPDLVTIQLNN